MRITDYATGETYFRKRRRRYDLPRQARELTFSCFHRYQFLSRDRTRLWFIDAMQSARQRWPLDIWAYVIMPEHVHLLVYPRETGVAVGRAVGWMKEQVARNAIRYMKRHAPEWIPRITVREGDVLRRRFWQPGGGYDRNATEILTIHQMIEYIHANPVRRGLSATPVDWEWSSARWYVGQTSVIEMDRTLPSLFVQP